MLSLKSGHHLGTHDSVLPRWRQHHAIVCLGKLREAALSRFASTKHLADSHLCCMTLWKRYYDAKDPSTFKCTSI